MHANLALALRLESASSALGRWSAEVHPTLFAESAATSIPCGSGTACFVDESSPLTQIKGAGMIAPTFEGDIDAVEAFYEERMTPVTFILCPFADAAIFTYLSRRGYEIGSFENALFRPVSAADILPPDPDIVSAETPEEWANTVGESFFDVVTPAGLELGRTLYHLPNMQNLLIRDGETALAGAQLGSHEGLAIFQCDGTIRRYRRAGLQLKLIQDRLSRAAHAGCDMATADIEPGSASQRNYEKLGFRVAYTRVTLIKPE